MSATNEIRQRLAEAERKAAESPEALRAALASAEARDREVLTEAAHREQARALKATAVVDRVVIGRDKVEATAAALVEALAEEEASLDELLGYVDQQVLVGDIKRLVVTRAKAVLGHGFGAPPLSGPANRSLEDTVPRAWLMQLAGIKEK